MIERITRAFRAQRSFSAAKLGPGDDAAVISPRRGMHWVVTCDSFFERTHFLPGIHPPDTIGYKALARAISDLAAMGATPRYFLLALALAPLHTGKWLDRMVAGMARAARRHKVELIGGDTSAQPTTSLAMTVIGEVRSGQAVTRSGARPGHRLYVSGTLGEAGMGLAFLRRASWRRREAAPFLRRHFYPQPRVELGLWLARHNLASAMIDVSDGLSTDLRNLCRASKVGALVHAKTIPSAPAPRDLHLKRDPLQLALHGGDDYELLFTVPPRLARRIPGRFQGLRLTCIGRITRRKEILLETSSGSINPLQPKGWDPFRER